MNSRNLETIFFPIPESLSRLVECPFEHELGLQRRDVGLGAVVGAAFVGVRVGGQGPALLLGPGNLNRRTSCKGATLTLFIHDQACRLKGCIC